MQNDEKIFNLLERLYIDMQEMKSNMATKDDIVNMATKDDIANMATKDDIANMATKDDIAKLYNDMQEMKSNMATKDDIKELNNQIDFLGKELHVEIQSVHDEVTELRKDLNTMEIIATKNAYDISRLKVMKNL